MKRLMVMVMTLVMTICGAIAQPKTSDKAIWKQAQKKAKELSKEGWKIDGSKTLEAAIYDHYKKLLDENNQELIGQVVGETNTKTRQRGQSWATTNAANLYAKQARQMVAGRVLSEMGGNNPNIESPENFYEGYESKVAKEIVGELKKSFSVFREKKDGYIDYQIFFVVNEEAASKARIRAMENALAESEFTRANAERISKFVREGFQLTE